MKKFLYLILFFSIFVLPSFSQSEIFLPQEELVKVNPAYAKKVLSGILVKSVSDKEYMHKMKMINDNERNVMVVIYFDHYPKNSELETLKNLGLECFIETWTPPLPNHPYGFIHARMPSNQLNNTLSLPFVLKMDSGEYVSFPNNNTGGQKMRANKVWFQGYTGTGKKVAILDSGIDEGYDGTDFPSGYQRKDYSNYPALDDGVANTVTGHGTHVAASVLGRGALSSSHNNAYNGSGAFKGSAPDASMVFLKIGKDSNGSATSAAMEAAMEAAVSTYGADILSMSYGGWYTYHDGSSSTEQKVDWVFSQGKPFFLSAGNEGASARHYSGTVNANSSTGFIQVNMSNASYLYFNLVWYDGLSESRNLNFEYYDNSYNLLSKTDLGQTQSPRGTESRLAYYYYSLPAGTYYIKVFNYSSSNQFFHLYEAYGDGNVKFNSPDPYYTIGQPASADNGFAVGAYVSRKYWQASNSNIYSMMGGNDVEQIATFSSRGPRIDGVQKPEITAPGSVIISLRDQVVYTTENPYWIENTGVLPGTNKNYFVMQGTSMACPMAAGIAALYLQKYPTLSPNATPTQVYNALKNYANQSYTDNTPSGTWGYGKLDIYASINELPSVDGNRGTYEGYTLAGGTETPVNNGFGDSLYLKRFYTRYADSALYIFVESKINTAANDHITIWLDFSNYTGLAAGQNAGGQGLFNSNPNFKLDMEADFAIDINTGGTTTNCYVDLYRYFVSGLIQANQKMYVGNCGLLGAFATGPSSNTDWGGTTITANSIEIAYKNTATSLKGFEIRIPITALPGINTSSVLNKVFAAIVSNLGYFSNETIPENTAQGTNFGYNVNFSTVNVFDYFLNVNMPLPVELTNFIAETQKNGVKLSWITETETNNFGFEIERKPYSLKNYSIPFTSIGFIAGNANSNSKKEYSFFDNSVTSGSYLYRLKQIDNDGKFEYSKELLVHYNLPNNFELMQNFPNPFNPITTIKYSVAAVDGLTQIPVRIDVYNSLGQRIRTLENSEKSAGIYEVQFDGSEYPSGIYFVNIKAHNYSNTKKMILTK